MANIFTLSVAVWWSVVLAYALYRCWVLDFPKQWRPYVKRWAHQLIRQFVVWIDHSTHRFVKWMDRRSLGWVLDLFDLLGGCFARRTSWLSRLIYRWLVGLKWISFLMRGTGHIVRWTGRQLHIGWRWIQQAPWRNTFILLLLYTAANIIFLVAPVQLHVSTQKRATVLAATNLAPLLLGRDILLVRNFTGLSLQQYRLLFFFLVGIAATGAIIHVAKVAHRLDWTPKAVTGLMTTILLFHVAALSLLSAMLPRRKLRLFYTWPFRLLFVATIILLLTHVWLQPWLQSLEAQLPLSVACGMWLAALVARRLCHQHSEAAYRQYGGKAARLEVVLKRPITIYPGAYFYIYYSPTKIGRASAMTTHLGSASSWLGRVLEAPNKVTHLMERLSFIRREGPSLIPLTAIRWEVNGHEANTVGEEGDTGLETADQDGKYPRPDRNVTKLHFLLNHPFHMQEMLGSPKGSFPVTIDGPYGRDLGLDKYQTVCLVADWSGIAGTLPIAFSLASKWQYDNHQKGQDHYSPNNEFYRALTRRVNFFWIFKEGADVDCVRDMLSRFMHMDPKTIFFQIILYGPSVQIKIPEKFLRWHFKIHPWPWEDLLDYQLSWFLETSPSCAVSVCGSEKTRQTIRSIVYKQKRIIPYFENDYQPHEQGQDHKKLDPEMAIPEPCTDGTVPSLLPPLTVPTATVSSRRQVFYHHSSTEDSMRASISETTLHCEAREARWLTDRGSRQTSWLPEETRWSGETVYRT